MIIIKCWDLDWGAPKFRKLPCRRFTISDLRLGNQGEEFVISGTEFVGKSYPQNPQRSTAELSRAKVPLE